MKLTAFTLLLLFPLPTLAQTELERINFFPKSKAFAHATYSYQFQSIETPKAAIPSKEVRNFTNLYSLGYGYRFGRKVFGGVNAFYEEASENVVRYGIPEQRRFTSRGLKEPDFFLLYRLREETSERSLFDLGLAFSAGGELRDIGEDYGNRINARNVLKINLSSGMREEQWEFQTLLGYLHYGEGEERNRAQGKNFILESYNEYFFTFQTQYQVSPWLYINALVGAFYRSTRDIVDEEVGRREIQSGSGSIFQLGLKKPVSAWTILELGYRLERNEYFVKGTGTNLEGDQGIQNLTLSLKQAF